MPKVMFSLPDQLVIRMKAAIPARERSKVIAELLEKEILKREQRLYLCARELEISSNKGIEIWEKEFSLDGLENV